MDMGLWRTTFLAPRHSYFWQKWKCMHYRHNKFQIFLQNLALDAHDALHRKSTLAFIRHCSRVGGGGGKDIFIKSPRGGHLRFWTFSKTNFGPFLTKDAKLWTFLYGVWFRGLEILQNIQNCGPFSTLRGSEVQLFKKNTKFWTFF